MKNVHKDKIVKALYELHLYPNKVEAMIKLSIFALSWIFGIFVLKITDIQNTVGCTYFVFALSLLMEFVPKINNMNECLSRVAHTCFCLIILIMFLLSAIMLIDPSNEKCHTFMFGLSICIVSYLAINLLTVWIGKNDVGLDNQNQNHDTDQFLAIYKKNAFEERLKLGNLGNIAEGEDDGG